jgi:LysM repeat protein
MISGINRVPRSSQIAGKAVLGLIALGVLWFRIGFAATPYKTYVVKRYKCWDILCDAYTVQRGDYVWELLRRRGCIVDRDLANFTAILKRLNPHIKNVNKIYPGQEVLVPLKQMEAQEGREGVDDRFVTIPFLPDILYSTYIVKPGDYLTKIAAEHHGLDMDQIPDGYLRTVKQINPGLKNLNRIYPGQVIRIPEIGSGGRSSKVAVLAPSADTGSASTSPGVPSASEPPRIERAPSPISAGVASLGGTLIESGHYFFPLKDKGDLKLDLSAFPIIELKEGRRILLDMGKGLSEDALEAIRAFWKPLTIVRTEPGESTRTLLDKIFQVIYGGEMRRTLEIPMPGDGIHVTLRGDWILDQTGSEQGRSGCDCITLIASPEERTSAPLRAYLAEKKIRVFDLLPEGAAEEVPTEARGENAAGAPAFTVAASDQEMFVTQFVKAIGYAYEQGVPLSFQYANFQVQTTANLMHGDEDSLDVVVDFGTLYGDAITAIEKGGLKVLSVKPEDEALTIARNMLQLIGRSWTEDPIFFGADRNVFKTTSVTIPGLLVSRATEENTLVTTAPLPPKICDFLQERGIGVVKIGSIVASHK